MRRWAKLSNEIGCDGRLAVLAEENALAALLFTWSLAAADAYGIVPGDPREYKARVGGALQLELEQIEAAINAQVEAGLVELYTAGAPLVYVRRYHRWQDVRWDRVGRPRYPLPPDWEVPEELREWLASPRSAKEGKGPEYYGLTAEAVGLGCGGGCTQTCIPPAQEAEEEGSKPAIGGGAEELGDGAVGEAGARPGGSWGTRVEDYGAADGVRAEIGMLKNDYPALSGACWALPFPPNLRDRWFDVLVSAIQNPEDWLRTEAEAVRCLQEHPPRTSERRLPEKWLERVGRGREGERTEEETVAQAGVGQEELDAHYKTTYGMGIATFLALPREQQLALEEKARRERLSEDGEQADRLGGRTSDAGGDVA